MSTYPVDIKTANITSATTTIVKEGATRILGLSWVVPTNIAAGTITVYDDTTVIWVVDTAATDTTSHKAATHGSIILPGTGIKCATKLKVINALVFPLTVYYG
jgi:hypothetical protein